MSVKGHIKEAAGYVKEELNERGTSPEAQRRAQEGRDQRNEGRVEDGKPAMVPSRAPAPESAIAVRQPNAQHFLSPRAWPG